MGSVLSGRGTDGTELDEAGFGRSVRLGILIGVPLTFVITLLLSVAGAGWGTAAAIAVWPGLVGGPFIGGFLVLMQRMSELEATPARITQLPVDGAAPPTGYRQAA